MKRGCGRPRRAYKGAPPIPRHRGKVNQDSSRGGAMGRRPGREAWPSAIVGLSMRGGFGRRANTRPPRFRSGVAGISPAAPSEKFARLARLGSAVIRSAQVRHPEAGGMRTESAGGRGMQASEKPRLRLRKRLWQLASDRRRRRMRADPVRVGVSLSGNGTALVSRRLGRSRIERRMHRRQERGELQRE